MKKTTAIIIAIIALFATAAAAAEIGDRGEFYPRLAVVTAYEQIEGTDEWIIICTDKDGEEWAFYGEEEDARIGNVFNLLMWNIGETETDDEIIEVYYEGRMDHSALRVWLCGEWQ